MKRFTIHGKSGDSSILVGERLENLAARAPDRPMIVITDKNVRALYGDRFPDAPVIEIGSGETIKTVATVEAIFERLVELEADRSAFITGVGGGIVCDITGFVASTYMRGVRFGFVATTLLAQVDASVGGKNGVNFRGYKNMMGVFNQPEMVICDTGLLHTLSATDIQCGFAEIIKHALIADEDMFESLEANVEAALALEQSVMKRLVYDSVAIKAGVVNRDETEQGERRKLNFGHTFGHALEKVTGIPHGQAVGIGMAVALSLSARRGYLSEETADRAEALLRAYRLPTRTDADIDKVLDAFRHDKKREGGHIHFVLLRRIGEAVVERLPINQLEAVIHELHQQ